MLTTKNYMTREVVTISKEASLLEAYKIMYEKRIRHLPVIDNEGIVIGMLSDRDVQRAMVINRAGGADSEEIYLNQSKKVSEYMSVIAFTALPDSPLTSIIDEMMKKKISAVIITDEKLRCAGIVTSNDIMRVFLEHLDRDDEIFEKSISFFSPNVLY